MVLMNKKGQFAGLGIAIIVAIMIFMIGMLNLNFIKEGVTVARQSSNLDCSSATISDGTKLTCLVVDAVVPMFILTIMSAAGGYITSKLLI